MNKGSEGAGEAIVDVVEQSHDDDKSLRRRQGLDSMEIYWLDFWYGIKVHLSTTHLLCKRTLSWCGQMWSDFGLSQNFSD